MRKCAIGGKTEHGFSSYDNPHLGSDHGDDLDAFFSPPGDADTDDLALFEAMREYWTSFVTGGVPTAKNSPAWEVALLHHLLRKFTECFLQPVTATSGSPRMLLHPEGIGMEAVLKNESERCTFWHSLSGEIQT